MGWTEYLHQHVLTADLLSRSAQREAKCEKTGGHPIAELDQVHLLEAVGWLIRAQDTMPYGGLSRGYSFGWNPYFPKKGWQPANPKAAGEAISTLFDCATILTREDLHQRAIELANWLIKIQMSSGAIRGGALDEPPSPEVLNTACAITGWTRAFRETGTDRFALATRRACDFLIQALKAQEAEEAGLSQPQQHIAPREDTRVGLALIQAGIALEEYPYCASGEKSVARTLRRQRDNGWLQGGSSDLPQRSLLGIITSNVSGILETALILDNNKYLLAAKRTADSLLKKVREDGSMPGRFASDWSPQVTWSCSEGSAQAAHIWLKLQQITGQEHYLNAAQRVILFIKRTQNRLTSNPGLRGGIKGAFPCDADFGRFQTLSSATKSFIDALLLLSHVAPVQGAIPTAYTSSSR